MLIAEVKVSDKVIARIEATRGRMLSDKTGDFVGDRATVCEYKCSAEWKDRWAKTETRHFTITHDRRFGWQGLLHAITGEILPDVVETISAKDLISSKD